jgi:glutamyl-tRNA synthetase
MMISSKVRGRFAPSPTGFVHIGSFRTALFNYLFVKKKGGDVVLRIEDTDQKRFVAGSVENLLAVFETLGVTHDEGVYTSVAAKDDTPPVIASPNYPGILEVGAFSPYIQSERLERYREAAEALVQTGHAYYCFCTTERLETMRAEQMKHKQMPKYDRACLLLSQEEIARNKVNAALPRTIRFRLPDHETIVANDLVRGEISFGTDSMSDAVLLKSDGYPTYHLAMAVDDHAMQITHVIRGEEWLASLPLHLLLYRAFGWEAPQFAHLPIILNFDKSKLSKRQGDVAVEDYLKKGYLPEAIINFVALLGWNEGEGSTQEIFSLEELIEKFDISRIHKAGAVFDIKKLDWINAQYIKKLSVEELLTKTLPFWQEKVFFKEASPEQTTNEYLARVLTIEQERLNRLDGVGEQNPFFFTDAIAMDTDSLRWKKNTDAETKEALTLVQQTLVGVSETQWTREYLSETLLRVAREKRGDMLWPLRVALTGAKQSPSPFDVAWVLGKSVSLARVARALSLLGK